MLRRALAASAVVSLLFAASAGAQDDDERLPFADARTYIQLGGTNAVENFDISPASAVNAVGFNFRWGKRVQPHFAVETQFEYLRGFDLRKRTGAIEVREEPDLYSLGANVKGFILTGRVQPFLLAGFGGTILTAGGPITSPDGNEVGFSARVGGGLDVYFFEDLALSLEAAYVIPTGEVRQLEYLAVGWSLVYRFSSDDDE